MRLQEGLDILTARGVEPRSLSWMHWVRTFRVEAADVAGLGRPHSAEVKIDSRGGIEVRLCWTIDAVEFDAWKWASGIDDAEALGWLWLVALVDLDAAKAAHEAMSRREGAA